ncbi:MULTISPECIES: helix-turn-helix transcriptional regulator [Clostridium]|uniref:helix-turn-helix transcriptional regulator n=1 Tax=Clostridium TaxID=1485 RepID=UPI0004D6C09A|nr:MULTISPECIES: helix-turn-helix transcriptional regulator [Clostridium]KEH88849.1 putative transcriptional regulator [Clostridium novyi A str. GD211209]KEH91561.1 DNA-binding protein [Clostridium botulinum C/D str. BKT12695]
MKATLKDLRNNIEGIYSITTIRVAHELGISREQYSRIENGFYKPNNLKIEKLATLFKVTENEIIKAWNNSRGGKANERNIRN